MTPRLFASLVLASAASVACAADDSSGSPETDTATTPTDGTSSDGTGTTAPGGTTAAPTGSSSTAVDTEQTTDAETGSSTAATGTTASTGASSIGGSSSGSDSGSTGPAALTWDNFGSGFFEAYCWECHGAGDPLRDYSELAGVLAESAPIRCGTGPAGNPPPDCGGEPSAGRFPAGATLPSDAEREMLVAWIDAGAPES